MTRSTGIRLLACSLALVACAATPTYTVRAEMDPIPLLQQALRSRVTIHINPRTGFMVPAYHCRRAQGGCDARLLEFAHYLQDAGERFEVDPWLLAAMAFRESSLNPFAVGAIGERGILQLHPRGSKTKNVRFVKDQWYRDRCKNQLGACQREVVDRAAMMLASSLEKCGGDLEGALGMYNAGRCGANPRYAERVLAERQRLKRAVGLEIEGLPPNEVLVRDSRVPARRALAATQ
jgi:hypothetical protein